MNPISFLQFCAAVLGVRLTPAQRVLCLVAFDGIEPRELEGDDRELARQLFGDCDTIPPAARAVLVAVCGARGGKSYVLGGLYSLWRALTADLSSLAPGEQATALVVAPDTRLARQALRYALGAARGCPSIARLIESDSADGFVIRRPDGQAVAIEVLPATRGGSAVRGRSLVSAVLDECAFFRDESAVVNDADVFRAVAPRVLPGGLVVLASTPWAEAGLLFELFDANHGSPTTALAAHAPTTLLRPDARTRGMVERERKRDPDNARREFDAEFMAAGAGLFFSTTAVDGAVSTSATPRTAPPAGVRVGVGVDLALVRDAAAVVVVHLDGDTYTVAELVELRPSKRAPLRLSVVVKSFAAVAQRHGVAVMWGDQHELHAAREHLPDGCALSPGPGGQQGKVDTYTATRDLLHSGRVVIPAAYRRLAEQLRAVIGKPTPGGGLQITSPRRGGVHGDIASAFVLAVHALRSGVPPQTFYPAPNYADPRAQAAGFDTQPVWIGSQEPYEEPGIARELARFLPSWPGGSR